MRAKGRFPMPGKSGHHPIEVIAEVQSIELDVDRNGAYKPLLPGGSTARADFTALHHFTQAGFTL